MNLVSGTVLVAESGLGISGLIVKIQHVGFLIAPPNAPTRARGARTQDDRALVLGTATTDRAGAFSLTFQRSDLRGDGGLNLIVAVFAGLDSTLRDDAEPLATVHRPNVSARESFVVTIPRGRLEQADVPVPLLDHDIDAVVARMRGTTTRGTLLQTGSRAIFAERLEQRRARRLRAAPQFGSFLSALSGIPDERRNGSTRRYLAPGQRVEAANRAAIHESIHRINSSTAIGAAALSSADAARFADQAGNFVQAIPAAQIEPLLGYTLSPTLVRRNVALLCRDEPVDPCVLLLEGKEEPVPPPPPTPAPLLEPDTSITGLIDTLVRDVRSPESGVVFGLNGRATLDQVNQSVQGFAPHGGPADGPALYDFHHLRIAFEDVWQELFDDDVEAAEQKLYEQFVDLGLDPNDYLAASAGLASLVKDWAKLADDVKAVAQGTPPPVSVVSAFNITPAQWQALAAVTPDAALQPAPPANKAGDAATFFATDPEAPPPPAPAVMNAQDRLVEIAQALNTPLSKDYWDTGNEAWLEHATERRRSLRQQGERIIAHVAQDGLIENNFEQFHPLLEALGQAVRQPYRFTTYAANRQERSVNFGAVVTYRQRWQPIAYQPGRLVKTVPLAPKETRRFAKKVAVKQSRAEKEVASSLHARKSDITETSRIETAIVEKAQNKTNFQMSAKGGLKVAGIGEASAQAGASHSAATESVETKKAFREAVLKATEEYKAERTVEVSMTDTLETQTEESGEISNPNDEIPVTYLFYELQRRFMVSEQIHRLTPVVLVAQEFPKPNEIDEDWIVAHDWILRRVILDDTFIPAMDYLATKVAGDEVSLQETFANVELQRRVMKELKEEIVTIRAGVGRRYAALERSIERRANAIDAEEHEGFLEAGAEMAFGSLDPETPEAARVREDAAREAYEREAKLEKEMVARLERETTALTSLTEFYTKALSEHLNRKAQIARLRVHLKANIMYYMHAIWNHEPPDQRFFRLHDVPVPKLIGDKTYSLEFDPDAVPGPPDWQKPLKIVMKCELDLDLEFQPLHQVADLDSLMGFKGNYMIFSMKQRNDLTDFLMLPYIDREVGLRDPDPLGNWTMADFIEYVCCLRKTLSETEFTRLMPGLVDAYQRILAAGGGQEEIVVPTDSLFIEALPGAHSLLEDFKLLHRAVDVRKVQADVRAVEFENVRYAARLREGEREDPTIEKRIVVEGSVTNPVIPVDQ